MAIASDYARHALDLSLDEVMPTGPGDGRRTGMRRRDVLDLTSAEPVVIPGVRADDEFHVARKKVLSRSELLSGLKFLLDAALARAGAWNSDEDDADLVALSEEAGLTLAEYEATTMRADGLKWAAIGKAQGVSQGAARRAGERGFEKLRKFVTSC